VYDEMGVAVFTRLKLIFLRICKDKVKGIALSRLVYFWNIITVTQDKTLVYLGVRFEQEFLIL
jgi:hypothetical protein